MKRRRALLVLKESPHYAREQFLEGFRRCGFDAGIQINGEPTERDVVVLWNRYRRDEPVAKAFEAASGLVLVAENGYIGRAEDGTQLIALAKHQHAGSGDWPVGGPERWERFNIELKPWRLDGDEIVVLPQRGMGNPDIAMPMDWPRRIEGILKARTTKKVRIRPHPGMGAFEVDPVPDLLNAYAAVTWASGAGIKALAAGIPMFCCQPNWIGASASCVGVEDLENPFRGNRLPMFQRLAWAQWRKSEIRSGEALQWLLQ